MAIPEQSHQIYSLVAEVAATPRSVYTMCGFATGGANQDSTPPAHKLVAGLWIQNKHATESLYVQCDATPASAANIEVKAGETYVKSGGGKKYDITEYFVRVTTDNNPFSVELEFE